MARKKKPSTDLTPRQLRFVELYVAERNASKAYTGAYKRTGATAEVNGSRLLRDAKVAAAIAARTAVISAKSEVTAVRVLEELARVAFSDMRRFAKWGAGGVTLAASEELGEDDARCVSEVSESVTKDGGTIKFKLHDKVTALTLLGKHLGMFPERLAIEDPAGQSDEELAKRREALRRRFSLST